MSSGQPQSSVSLHEAAADYETQPVCPDGGLSVCLVFTSCSLCLLLLCNTPSNKSYEDKTFIKIMVTQFGVRCSCTLLCLSQFLFEYFKNVFNRKSQTSKLCLSCLNLSNHMRSKQKMSKFAKL